MIRFVISTKHMQRMATFAGQQLVQKLSYEIQIILSLLRGSSIGLQQL